MSNKTGHFRCLFLLIVLSINVKSLTAAPSQVNSAVEKAVSYLSNAETKESECGLVVYALVKGTHKVDSPPIRKNLQKVLAKFDGDVYKPVEHHFYEAAIDAMALEAVDPAKYRDQLQKIVDYIIKGQLDSGGWFYADQVGPAGDTSITQYSLLGLWAGARAGINVPAAVWERAGQWHLGSQRGDGSHEYQPTKTNSPSLTMTAAGCGSLALINRQLFGESSEPKRAQGKKKFGVLQQVDLDRTAEAGVADGSVSLKTDQLQTGAKRAFAWLSSRHNFLFAGQPPLVQQWQYYYIYTVERVCSLNDIKQINGVDWYEDGCRLLIKTQSDNGSWKSYEPVSDTCFGVLFLTQATAQILGDDSRAELLGGGLLIGGRGLPDNLAGVVIQDGNVKSDSPADGMDAIMKKLSTMDLDVLEDEVKQLDIPALLKDPIALMANGPVFYQLIEHKDPQIRLKVVESLIESDRLEVTEALIQKLSDENWGIVAEAHRGLKIISRKPFGVGGQLDPSGYLPDGVEETRATFEQRDSARERFHVLVIKRWEEWHDQAVPK